MAGVNMDPMEHLVDDITSLTRDFISNLTSEWTKMYNLDADLRKKYAKIIVKHVKEMYDEMLISEQTKQKSMVEEIEKCLEEHSRLQKELHIKIENHARDDDPLQTILNTLNNDLKEYREIRDQRLKQLEDLRKKEADLCELLGNEPLIITSSVPSPRDLQELDQHICCLRQTKIARTDQLTLSRERLREMMQRLELLPMNAFEQDVTGSEPPTFKLTVQNMSKLEDTVRKYENLITEATERVSLLEAKLEKLWERICIPDEERMAFNASYYGIGSSAVCALTDEIERCEILKRANMKSVIEMVRKEIVNLWDIMTFTPEKRMDFTAYFTDTYTEEVLELHEMEQARLQEYYEKYQDLFRMAERRDQLLEKMEDFAASAKDPNRYKNRGGQLLREEKERKSTEGNLSKITSQLKKMLTEYQQENNRPFLWHGEDLLASMDKGTMSKPNHHLHLQKTPVAKENKPATKRKIGHADEAFTEHIEAGSSPAKRARATPATTPAERARGTPATTPAKRACGTPASTRTPMSTLRSRLPVPRTPGTKTPRRFV